MDQNINYNKAAYKKSTEYRYKEPWIDSYIGRPWTWLETKLMKKLIDKPGNMLHPDFVFSFNHGLFWPPFLVRIVMSNMVKAGYVAITYGDGMYMDDVYKLTDLGHSTYYKKLAYET